MRWFLDTEFDENGTTIKLISIALVSEAGDEYCRVLANGWRPDDCDDWVKANVLPHLPTDHCDTRSVVAEDLKQLLLRDGKPEIWGYFADYDWVAFCQLFGKMVDLPDGFPMFCLDLKQAMVQRGITKEMLPAQSGAAHDALADARWIRDAYVAMRSYV